MDATHMYDEVIQFWFEQTPQEKWWSADPAFDSVVRERFGDLIQQAVSGELHAWRDTPKGRLAEIIVLDQFPRNAYRNTPRAFACDPVALVLAQEAVRANAHMTLTAVETGFLLMPFMHSESAQIHAVAEQLFRDLTPSGSYEYELKHKLIIDRFGRYPHRNTILGRTSTKEELIFLLQPDSRF